jgi:hypothetical protein
MFQQQKLDGAGIRAVRTAGRTGPATELWQHHTGSAHAAQLSVQL